MSTFHAGISWHRETPDFSIETYDRTHNVSFPGGTSYKASAAPDYKGNQAYVNPEEGLLAALTSCHMLTFLAVASRSGYVVDSYEDQSSAELGKITAGEKAGKLGMVQATLRPKVVFSGAKMPSAEDLARLHEKAHQNCFIANSVTTKVTVEPHA